MASSLAHGSESPARTMAFWGAPSSLTWEQKINRKLPGELLAYLKQDNQANGWSNVPKAAVLKADFLQDVKAAVNELPPAVRVLIDKKLIGLFFVTDLGGSGYTESVLSATGEPKAAIVVLDVEAVDKAGNAWATWKDSSPFAIGAGISTKIAPAGKDNRRSALQYILLHEFGHVVSVGNPLLPGWSAAPKDVSILPAMEFFNLSWKKTDNVFASRFDGSWPSRGKIAYYASDDKKLSGSTAVLNYQALLYTDFPTMYAATNVFDDWAESFANYVHVVLLKKPWQVTVKGSDGASVVVNTCWTETRCHDKRVLLEKWLAL